MLQPLERYQAPLGNDEGSKDVTLNYQITHAVKGRLRVRISILINAKELTLCQSRFIKSDAGLHTIKSQRQAKCPKEDPRPIFEGILAL